MQKIRKDPTVYGGNSRMSGRCGCMLAFIAVNLILGGLSFDYVLGFVFGKDIHWTGDAICGLFLGELAIPGAVVCFVLSLFGVEAPMV